MKILLVWPRIPFPARDGGSVVMAQTARHLRAGGHEVRWVGLNTSKHHTQREHWVNEWPDGQAIDLDTTITFGGALRNLLTSRLPYNIERFISPQLTKCITQALADFKPDVIQFEGAQIAVYASLLTPHATPMVLRAHNVEYRIWKQLAVHESHVFKRYYYHHLAQRGLRYERELLRCIQGLISITDQDAAHFTSVDGYKGPLTVIPAGTQALDSFIAPPQGGPPMVGFLGSLDWKPNLEGLKWFCQTIWPTVRQRLPDARFRIAGRNPDAELATLNGNGVEVVGEIDDSKAFWADTQVSVIPLLSGSGMRVKLLESLAHGKAVVSTSLGAEGIPITHLSQAIIANKPEDFATHVVNLLSHYTSLVETGRNGWAWVKHHYSWEHQTQRMTAFYNRIIG
jgi:glycosyltransferase involved in cell wall biosynthesis